MALAQIQSTLDRFHQHREIFRELGIRPDGFSLPRQHSLVHYVFAITQFGAPNGLCSSITESKHIKAVKRPYRRSGKNKPMGQMLVTNQRIDKLAAVRTHFTSRGMLNGSPISTANAQLGIFTSHARDEPPGNDAAPELGTLRMRPQHVHPDHVTIMPSDEHARHDLQREDDPQAGAEISLAKKRGRLYNIPLVHLSFKDKLC